jgi:hypothetical protein
MRLKKLFHSLFKWHFVSSSFPIHKQGVNYISSCCFCKKNIMLDSQGNWYTYERMAKQ